MKKLCILLTIVTLAACGRSVLRFAGAASAPTTFEDSLYLLYSLPPDQWPKPTVDTSVSWTELGHIPPSPLAHPTPDQQQKILLGKALFFDARLSGSTKLSCASCHLPQLSWTDGREKSLGHDDQPTKRNSPTLLNVWFYTSLFWDGRSSSLEDQAFSPINSSREMHSSMGDVVRALRKIEGYGPLFKKAFGTDDISPETITQAIATFERTLVSAPAAFDRFIKGDKQALTPSAIRGLHLFRTKAGCMNCHHGPLLTDNGFHNTGLAEVGSPQEDLGLYMVSHQAADVGKFKTPSLRDVWRTGPWMHNGMQKDLREVISSYSTGRRMAAATKANPLFQQPDALLKPVALSEREINDIIAFLEAVSAPPPPASSPVLP